MYMTSKPRRHRFPRNQTRRSESQMLAWHQCKRCQSRGACGTRSNGEVSDGGHGARRWQPRWRAVVRGSEEHTSEVPSHDNLVCRLLLEKKKQKHHTTIAKSQLLRFTYAASVSRYL